MIALHGSVGHLLKKYDYFSVVVIFLWNYFANVYSVCCFFSLRKNTISIGADANAERMYARGLATCMPKKSKYIGKM